MLNTVITSTTTWLAQRNEPIPTPLELRESFEQYKERQQRRQDKRAKPSAEAHSAQEALDAALGLEEEHGRLLAWEDEQSSGFLMPKKLIRAENLGALEHTLVQGIESGSYSIEPSEDAQLVIGILFRLQGWLAEGTSVAAERLDGALRQEHTLVAGYADLQKEAKRSISSAPQVRGLNPRLERAVQWMTGQEDGLLHLLAEADSGWPGDELQRWLFSRDVGVVLERLAAEEKDRARRKPRES